MENVLGSAWKMGASNLVRHWSRIAMRWASPRLGAGKARGSSFSDETPLRAELFNSDQMEQHGKRLASAAGHG